MLFMAIASFAHDFEVDGIYYVITSSSSDSPSVSVSYEGASYDYSNEYTGSVTIPEAVTYSGKTYSVTSIGNSAFDGCSGLTNITIPSSVTSIGSSAFYGCSGLISIVIPNSVVSIGYDAFRNCTDLTSITIPASLNYIGAYAFAKCTSLKKVIINDIAAWCNISFGTGTSSPLASSNPLSYAKHLYSDENTEITSLEIPDDVISVSSNAFQDCIGLTSITIPQSVTDIGNYAFYGCNNIVLVKNKALTPPSIEKYTFSENTFGNALLEVDENCIENYIFSAEWGRFKQIGLRSDRYPFTYVVINNECTVKLLENDGKKISYDGDVNIPNTISISGDEYKVTKIADKGFSDSNIRTVILGNSIKEIGNSAFSNCVQLTSINIPESVTSIGSKVFEGCTALTDVLLNSNIASNTYSSLSSLKDIFGIQVKKYTLGDNVTTIGKSAFNGCSGLTSITIPSSVTTIGNDAFYGCSGLTSITIPESVTSIGSSAFDGTAWYNNQPDGLVYAGKIAYEYKGTMPSNTSIVLDEGTSGIAGSAFEDCTGLTSITIPSSVTSIGSNAFSGCTALTDVSLNSNAILSKTYSYSSSLKNIFGTQVKTYTIGDNVTTIGNYAFYGCSELMSITIPSGVTSIGNYAFYHCSSLTSVTLNSNDIVSKSYNNTSSLKNVFGGQVKSYILGDNIKNIGRFAFFECSDITSITIPSSVTSIGYAAFSGCSGLTSIILPDNITSLGYKNGSSSFPTSVKLYVNIGSKTLLALWNHEYFDIYDAETQEKIYTPYLSEVSSTQTTLKVKLNNIYDEYIYKYDGKAISGENIISFSDLRPEYAQSVSVAMSSGNYSYSISGTFSTDDIKPTVTENATSASSISASGSYTKGDAEVIKETIKFNGKTVEGKNVSVNGLAPNTSYDVEYTVTVAYGSNNQSTYSYTSTKTVKTQELTLTTEQPKVVSMGNVIVSATTNVDPEEKNVGFEWRREDWSSTFASQSGAAVVLDGTMEGYIRNLYTDKLWNYRAYYLSDSGTYYYGDWVGIDPTNTSYFEPTVYTYADISTSGKVALIRGYVLNGTDKVTVQGFKYWKTANKSNSLDIAMESKPQAAVVYIPADAITETVAIVGAGQQLMNAMLENLDYGSTYQCVAFATTSENETFYGEVQSFTTEADPTGIEGVKEDAGSSKPVIVVACYDINGKRLSAPQKGLNIIKMSDGTTRKIVR